MNIITIITELKNKSLGIIMLFPFSMKFISKQVFNKISIDFFSSHSINFNIFCLLEKEPLAIESMNTNFSLVLLSGFPSLLLATVIF